ncbi:MAG: glycosyltransferase [Nitrospirae bacterium]|nr:glycosyltransferase [Nitrospirota bacterium]
MEHLTLAISILFAGYYVINVLLMLAGIVAIKGELGTRPETSASRLLPITVIIPAYNEEDTIVSTIRVLAAQKYPFLDIIVVNDGSGDGTLRELVRAFSLVQETVRFRQYITTAGIRGCYRSAAMPSLQVIDKDNGGKADAINAGLNLAGSELVCILDADVIPEKHAMLYMVQPFVQKPGENVLVTGGNVRIHHGSSVPMGTIEYLSTPKKWIYLLQILEYIRSFSLFRLGWSAINSVPLVSGAAGMFRRVELLRLGGFQKFSKGEDMEIIMRLHEYYLRANKPYRIIQLVRPVIFTGAPSSIKELAGQRKRWQVGLLSTLRVYKHLIFNRKFKAIGILVLPYFLIFEALSPFIEMGSYLALGLASMAKLMSFEYWLVFIFTIIGGGALNNLCAIVSESHYLRLYTRRIDLVKLMAIGVLEPFGYHQLNQLWKIQATFTYLSKTHLKSTWQPPKREGDE